jgi:uncharacterized iron-regulated membrane protein
VRGNLLQRVRQLHTWLGVFFSPLLLLFIITGWWQTFATEDTKDKGFFNSVMAKFSTIHTDSYFAHNAASHHPSAHFKIIVACMAVTLILTILLGLALACQTVKRFWLAALAFLLGILIPATALYFN